MPDLIPLSQYRSDLDPARGVINALAIVLTAVILGMLLVPVVIIVCRW